MLARSVLLLPVPRTARQFATAPERIRAAVKGVQDPMTFMDWECRNLLQTTKWTQVL